ncbi:adenosylcobinamide-phosphate synthase CbiB [Dysgonomonas sp. Marseille-P4361]|uniref:adenosylcobinamide-phosphate synthase CbiB n=1 Tax=Dysgonomonas sp. Marseille-P4361 TaxID=2161820 RepID=UPI000D561AC9|nr:adenosylcobinamide-phosphate synthase CbiB [Dysgonomonas sp. Marseille-P4361]
MDITFLYILLPLIVGWIADFILGDPQRIPHPVVGFGKLISWCNKYFNRGKFRMLKGAICSVLLIGGSFFLMYALLQQLYVLSPILATAFSTIIVFFCLAGETLVREVKQVFLEVDFSLGRGRQQVARIVGRDTSGLSKKQIQIASLETLSENLSDGVIAPMFWYMILGVPGMFAYKMINTLDSMIGYKNEKYKDFGCWAARIDDVANYIPARLTALLMLLAEGKLSLFSFVKNYGKMHASPNSGYPEAALAGILNCRFGGPNSYFGQVVDKLYIGNNDREITLEDMSLAVKLNKKVEVLMILLVIVYTIAVQIIFNS